MKTRSYFLTQTLIFFVPALIATSLFQTNPNITPPIEDFFWYRGGILGIFLMYYIRQSLSISYTSASIIAILIYSVIFFYFCYLSKSSRKRMRIMHYVNITLTFWGILSGFFWQIAAMF